MDLQQMANLRIYEEFEKRNIEFSYPTQTLYLART
jgi:small-conductance mechanosensitive channel